MNNEKGYIYILTNPSFPEFIKIGYATNVERRIKELNRSECIPFAFRIYATYEVNTKLSDKEVHKIIDNLNPNLRSIENHEGKERKREFYALAPEIALGMLESMARIHGVKDNVKIYELSTEEQMQETVAIQEREKRRVIKKPVLQHLIKWNIVTVGTRLSIKNHPTITATLLSEKEVEFNGVNMSCMNWAKDVLGFKNLNFYDYACIEGSDLTLSDLRTNYMLDNNISLDEDFNE